MALDLPDALTAARGTLLFGDLHGTREMPRFIADVVTALVAHGPVVLALEIRGDQAPSLPAFVAGEITRAETLHDEWWQGPYFDGRNSIAMLELLEAARHHIAAGAPLQVHCFDAARPASYQIDPELREAIMASTLLEHRAARPDAIFVGFAGNLHTRRTAWREMPGFASMAMRMAASGLAFTTLDARYASGTAWECGVEPGTDGITEVHGLSGAPGIYLGPVDGHDGTYNVGPVTASPPAIHALRVAG